MMKNQRRAEGSEQSADQARQTNAWERSPGQNGSLCHIRKGKSPYTAKLSRALEEEQWTKLPVYRAGIDVQKRN